MLAQQPDEFLSHTAITRPGSTHHRGINPHTSRARHGFPECSHLGGMRKIISTVHYQEELAAYEYQESCHRDDDPTEGALVRICLRICSQHWFACYTLLKIVIGRVISCLPSSGCSRSQSFHQPTNSKSFLASTMSRNSCG